MTAPATLREISIWTATFAIAEGDQVRRRSEWPRSGLPSLATAESDQVREAQESGLSSLATADDNDGHPDCLLSLLLGMNDLDCLLLIRLSLISSAKLQTAIPRYWWWRSGLPWDFPTVVNEFCFPVKVSLCRSLSAALLNVATSQPGHRLFACLLIAPEGLGSESRWKWWARGSGFFCKNFSPFPPEKAKFLFRLAWPLSQVGSFWAL